MGWTGTSTGGLSNADYIKEVYEEGGRNKVLAQSKRGTVHYLLLETNTGEVTISVVLTITKKFHWDNLTYKTMNESSGPNYFDCPLSWLDKLTAPYNDWAKQWREDVRRIQAEKAEKRKERAGGKGFYVLGNPPELKYTNYKPEFCFIPKREKGKKRYVHAITRYKLSEFSVGDGKGLFTVPGDSEHVYQLTDYLIRLSPNFLNHTDAKPMTVVPFIKQVAATE